ncbi:MAG: MaoC family dehydratase, partial [Diaphorobacter sp.]|nr:MaoC family dehydratase [Diaphorobacter sp.]
LARFMGEAFAIESAKMGVNYGLNRVRFPAPVPVGSRLRAQLRLLSAEPLEPAGVQMVWEVAVEREGGDKPVCVAEALVRSYGAPA